MLLALRHGPMVTNGAPQVSPKTSTHHPHVVFPVAVPLSARRALSPTQQLLGIVDGLGHNVALSQEACDVREKGNFRQGRGRYIYPSPSYEAQIKHLALSQEHDLQESLIFRLKTNSHI